jgi:hypothetical protein
MIRRRPFHVALARCAYWINQVGLRRRQDPVIWEDQPTGHYDARDRVELPRLADAGTRFDIPVWALADSWPDGFPDDLQAGVRGGGRDWMATVDRDVRVTG